MVAATKIRQEYLVAYDVADDKIRSRTYNELEKHGLRAVQKSVFWGYLTQAELQSIKRYFENILKVEDKAFVTHSNFNGRGKSYFVGHTREDFKDWEEAYVV